MNLSIGYVFMIFYVYIPDVLSAPSIKPLAELIKKPGCLYENRRYKEGDNVQTTEPCVRCHCSNNNVICRLRVCIQVPDPPPPGCFILHHQNECCPKLVCNSDMGYSSGSNSIIEARSGSTAIESIDISNQKGSGCLHNGTLYAEGSAMDTSSLCEYCYCIKGKQLCMKPQCLLALPNCEPVYNQHACCPTKYNCSKPLQTTTLEPLNKNGCNVNGKYYMEGEMINGTSKHCETCYCLHGGIRCEPIICTMPSLPNQQCSPVYTTGHCCPSSYKCVSSHDNDEMAETRHYSSIEIPSTTLMVNGISETKALNSSPDEQGQANNSTETGYENNTMLTTTPLIPSTTIVSINSTKNDTKDEIAATYGSSETTTTLLSTTSLSDNYTSTLIDEITTMLSTSADDEETTLTTDEMTTDNNLTTTDTDDLGSTFLPTDATVLPTLTDINETESSSLSASTTQSNFKGYNYTKSAGYISPEIEAIINITKSKEDSNDYEYDYNEPSLPPSLPNLKIIPFVAADAVVTKSESTQTKMKYTTGIQYPAIHEKPPLITHATKRPIYYKESLSNRFSPPTETEGGFVPREPIIDPPFYESKVDSQPSYHTPGYNIDITVPPPPTEIPILPQTQSTKICVTSNGVQYNHGELIPPLHSCDVCTCFFGEIMCQEPKCPTLQPGCIRVLDQNLGCCGRLICGSNELDSPTRVIERVDHVTQKSSISKPQASQNLPPYTIAELIVTPDPFRDVIRTEPAPDLPSLMGDIMHLWEHTTKPSTSTLPSITTGSPEEYSFVHENTMVASANSLKANETETKNSNTFNAFGLTNATTENVSIKGQKPQITTSKIIIITNSSTDKINDEILHNDESTTSVIIISSNIRNLTEKKENNSQILTTQKILTSTNKSNELDLKNNDKTGTKNTEELNGEQKTEDVSSENNGFSFSSMFDYFFNAESENVTKTPTTLKPISITEITNNSTDKSDNCTLKMETNYQEERDGPIERLKPGNKLNKTQQGDIKNNHKITMEINDLNLNKSKNIDKSETIKNLATIVMNNSMTTESYLDNKNILNQVVSTYDTNNANKNENSTIKNDYVLINQLTTLIPLQSGADPGAASGLLKLAGCNVYGRMYRVGRIISELSGPCLECMCTELGVQCRPLNIFFLTNNCH